jgi:hypothetical protein
MAVVDRASNARTGIGARGTAPRAAMAAFRPATVGTPESGGSQGSSAANAGCASIIAGQVTGD